MNQEPSQPAEGLGLLANGSSLRWDIAVDESLDGSEWSLEIDGPQTYLVFQLQDLTVLPKALRFLQAGPQTDGNKDRGEAEENALRLGQFGSASVSLLRDNETFPRCFIVIGPKARSTLRISLDAVDVQMLSDALGQALHDLPDVGEG